MTSSQSARRPSAVRVLQTQGHLGKVEQVSVIRRDAASVQRVSTAHTRASILGLWIMVDLLEKVKTGGINTSHSIRYTAVMWKQYV